MKTATTEKKQVLQVRVSPSEKKAIKQLAEEAHLSISSYVRLKIFQQTRKIK